MRLFRGDDGSPLRYPAFFSNTRFAAAQYATFSRGGRVRTFEFSARSTLVLSEEPEAEDYPALFESARAQGYDSIHWPGFEVAYDQWVVLDPECLVEIGD